MGLFHKRDERATSPTEGRAARTSHSPKGGGIFRRGSSSSPSSSDGEHTRRRHSPKGFRGAGLFHRRDREDPSIAAARQTLASAEEAEHAAGRAVTQARTAVAEAREHVKRLEGEAREEYACFNEMDWDDANVIFRSRHAKLKRTTAKDLGKRSKPLGRRLQIRPE